MFLHGVVLTYETSIIAKNYQDFSVQNHIYIFTSGNSRYWVWKSLNHIRIAFGDDLSLQILSLSSGGRLF